MLCFPAGAALTGLAIAGGGWALAASPSPTPLPVGAEPVTLNPSEFTPTITNPYLPLRPGTRMVYRETSPDGETARSVMIVTSQTKRLANGITARVVRDTATEEGAVVEDTFDWYAQDSGGNVWYLGEDTAEFENGRITSRAGSFEAGAGGTLAGIAMPANPTAGMRYRQEYAKGKAEDNGEVLSVAERAQTPAGFHDDVVLTKDTNALKPRALEYKLYAPGVGMVISFDVAGSERTMTELVRVSTVRAAVARRAGTAALGRFSA